MSESKTPFTRLRDWLRSGNLPEVDGPLVLAARAQGLSALLACEIESRSLGPLPLETLRRDRYAVLADGVRKLEAAARALSVLGAKGLRALPLKGAAIAETFCSSVADRPMKDVDVLALDSFEEAIRTLEISGFTVIEKADHAWALTDSETNITVELHRSFTSCPGFFPVKTDDLWSRSREAAGQISRIPSSEDLLVHLSLHAAFQHGLVLSLVQWLDFRRVLESATWSLQRLIACAVEARAEASLAVALETAAVVVGGIPNDLLEAVDPFLPQATRRWLAGRPPLSFVEPAVPQVARLRWSLAQGRRGELLRRTLDGGEQRSPARRIKRAGALLARFGPAFLS